MKTFFLSAALAASSFMLQAQSSGPVAAYSFNQGNANDEVGDNHGVVSGATLTADRFGNPNAAYNFNGASFIDFGDSTEFQMGTSDFSLSMWVNYSQVQEAFIVSKRAGSAGSFNMYYVGVMGNPLFGGASLETKSLLRGSNGGDRTPSAGDISGAWHHVVLRHTLDSTSYFVDGQWVNSDTNSFFGGFDVPGYPLVAGYSSQSLNLYYTGDFDDFFVYRRALSHAEIDSLYNVPNHVVVGVDAANHVEITAYPNPSNGKVQFSAPVAEVKVLNVAGQMVYSAKSVHGLDLQGQPAGVYLFEIGDGHGNALQRIQFLKN